jgi:hypothetical protein
MLRVAALLMSASLGLDVGCPLKCNKSKDSIQILLRVAALADGRKFGLGRQQISSHVQIILRIRQLQATRLRSAHQHSRQRFSTRE